MTEDPNRWGQPLCALLGALQRPDGLRACRPSAARTACPAPSSDMDVPPTLVSFAVDISDKQHVLIRREFKKPGSKIVRI